MHFTDYKKMFAYEHLPRHLQEISKPFHDLAEKTIAEVKISSAFSQEETKMALRKLLEAKDCAVRAQL